MTVPVTWGYFELRGNFEPGLFSKEIGAGTK